MRLPKIVVSTSNFAPDNIALLEVSRLPVSNNLLVVHRQGDGAINRAAPAHELESVNAGFGPAWLAADR
jgi:hypothetical protein